LKLDLAGSRKRPRLGFLCNQRLRHHDGCEQDAATLPAPTMRVMIVDDEPAIRKTTGLAVETMGHETVSVPNGLRALKTLEEGAVDVCFLDVNLGQEDGLAVLEKLLQAQPSLVVVMFTAFANISTAVEAMRRGAFDFIPKPFTPDQIRQVLDKVVRARKLEQRVQQLETQLMEQSPQIDFESGEPAVQKVLQMAFKAAETAAKSTAVARKRTMPS